jgi:hypothetical protein
VSRKTAISFVAALLALVAGPAWAEDAASRAVASYSRFELRELRSTVEVQPKVINKITTEIRLRLDESLARWNQEGSLPGHAGTLAIEVEILQMKFVSGGKRFFVGAMAGGSSCAAAAKLVDAERGELVARKVFGEMSGGRKGAHTMGATDNLMLDRLAANISAWVIEQHSLPATEGEPESETEADTEPDPVPAAG